MRNGTSLRIRFIGWRAGVLLEDFADYRENAESADPARLELVQQ
jgi:hypothetical protein